MTKQELIHRLQEIEWEDFEVKEAAHGLPKNSWDTVSAFSNTVGGWIIFGIKESNKRYEATGLSNPSKIEQDFTTALRGDKFNVKMNPVCKKYDFDGKIVLAFYISVSDKKPVYFNSLINTFIRTGSGDQRATKEEVDSMYRNQAFGTQTDKTIFNSDISWLDNFSLVSYRDYIRRNNPSHIYNSLTDIEFLEKLRVSIDGKISYSGLFFLGKNEKIQSVITDFRIDYFEIPGVSYSDAKTRYTFRLGEHENIWQYYFAIFNRLARQIELPFKLQADGSSTTDYPYLEALREALVNLLQHTEYFSPMKPRIRSFFDRIEFFNSGSLPRPLETIIAEDISLPRNGIIAKLFRVANLSENGGYGFEKMLKGWKTYNNTAPQYTADIDSFKVTFNTLKEDINSNADAQDKEKGGQTGGQTGGQREQLPKLTPKQFNVLSLISANPSITRKELSEVLGINESAVRKYFDVLKKKGVLERMGKTTDSYWKILINPDEFKD